jgi:hypothetical protein
MENLQIARNLLQGANFPAPIDAFGGLLTLFDIGVSKEAVRWVNYTHSLKQTVGQTKKTHALRSSQSTNYAQLSCGLCANNNNLGPRANRAHTQATF